MRPMRWEHFVARRYLRARRKQTLMSVVTAISIAGITVGVMALVIALGLMSGFQNDIKSKILGSNAHVLVFPLRVDGMKDAAAVMERIAAVPGVVAVAPVIYQRGMAVNERSGSESALLVKGVDPSRELGVTDIGPAMVVGELASLSSSVTGEAPIVLGDELAKELDVLPGDVVRIVALRAVTGPGGLMQAYPANRQFRVTGIFRTGMWDYDSEWAYVALPVAQEFYRMPERVSLVEVRLSHPDDAASAKPLIEAVVGDRYRVQTWAEMNRAFFSALQIEKVLLFLVISLIGMVAALNIATTLVMTVMEKGRDTAILMAMGAPRRSVTRIYRHMGLAIGVVGTCVGLALGIAACYLLDRYKLITLSPEVYYITHVPFRIEPVDFGLVALSALAISYGATLYPAWHASRLAPCEALRYE